MADSLTGSFFVRAIRPAFADVNHLFNRTRDKIEVRRHALKLRYWPDSITTEPSGQVVDLDWSWIRSLDGLKVGELRVHDTIGGQDNLRIIFFVGPPNDRRNPPQATRLQPVVRRVYPEGLQPVHIAFSNMPAYNWGMKDKKIASTFRLSETALKLLLKMAERGGTTKTAILEALIRQAAKKPDTK